jgi:hypothetical protein
MEGTGLNSTATQIWGVACMIECGQSRFARTCAKQIEG